MNVQTVVKTEVKKTVSHVAQIGFDTLLVSEKNFYTLLAEAVKTGEEVKFNLKKADYLSDDIGILQLNGELVATVTLEG